MKLDNLEQNEPMTNKKASKQKKKIKKSILKFLKRKKEAKE